jgi:hypothetical protein
MTDPVRQIADAVLYEGYLLWPYRRSATKNRQRWTFGGVYPPAHSAAHSDDPSRLQTEVVLAGGSDVDVRARFLQVVERSLLDPHGRPVDELDGNLAWDEATEREIGPGEFHIAPGEELEEVDGGTVVRSWRELRGRVDVSRAGDRFKVVVSNETPWVGSTRDDALRQTFCSTHVVLHTSDGSFVSATESPNCDNIGLWPVLVGEPGSADTVLAAPIILGDYPQIAPESPGDFFDSTEIDKLLILNVLALTPKERAEMQASDPRAREILARCEALSRDELMRLHGALRDFRSVGPT